MSSGTPTRARPAGPARADAGHPVAGRNGNGRAWAWLALAFILAGAGVVAGATFSGAVAGRETLDPGVFVRWALPISVAVHHLALAVVAGCLLFAAAVLPPSRGRTASGGARSQQHPAFVRVLATARAVSVVWVLAAVAVLVLTYADLSGQPVSGNAAFARELGYFTTDLIVGQAWAAVVAIAFVVCNLAFLLRSPIGLGWTAALACTATIPISLVGHAAGSDDHYAGVGALVVHWAGVLLWVGGVAALAILAPVLGRGGTEAPGGHLSARTVLVRFSALAGVAFCLVLGSGVVNSVLRLPGWDGLSTRYGQLILIKAAATLLLGAIGLAHRRWAIGRLGAVTPGRTAWRLVAAEFSIMAGVIGVTAALGRTAPPIPQELEPTITPAEVLTGYLLPPEPGWTGWLTQWRWDWLWVAIVLTAAAVYLMGAGKARVWPWPRTASWLTGLAVLLYVTCSAPTVYGMVLFSAHTLMVLALVIPVPLLLALGAPLQLTTLVVARRTDGSRGVREWLEAARPALASPGLTGTVLVGSIVLLYSTPALGLVLEYWIAHQVANLYFLGLGVCFMTSVVGLPLGRLAPRPARIRAVAIVAGVLLLWAVVLASGALPVLQPDWFEGMERTWGDPAALDQQLAGMPVLLAGFAPLAFLLAVMALPRPPRASRPGRGA